MSVLTLDLNLNYRHMPSTRENFRDARKSLTSPKNILAVGVAWTAINVALEVAHLSHGFQTTPAHLIYSASNIFGAAKGAGAAGLSLYRSHKSIGTETGFTKYAMSTLKTDVGARFWGALKNTVSDLHNTVSQVINREGAQRPSLGLDLQNPGYVL